MPSVLRAELLGQRVVVRRGTGPNAQAPFRDALGDLVALDGVSAVVETRAGRVEIPLTEISSARLVTPSARDQLNLERIAAKGWRARTVILSQDGWLLRADAGWTGRANSALALRSLRRPLRDALAEVHAFYDAHGLPPRISVPLPAGSALDTALAAAGWAVVDTADVMTARLDLLSAQAQSDLEPRGLHLDVATAASPEWLAACRYRGGPMPAAGAALLQRHENAMFASVRAGSVVVAVARGVLDDGWLGVTLLDVDANYRRRGLASAILRRLAVEARSRGARRAYLQVAADNAAAISLYRRLGWHPHHSYVYRVPA